MSSENCSCARFLIAESRGSDADKHTWPDAEVFLLMFPGVFLRLGSDFRRSASFGCKYCLTSFKGGVSSFLHAAFKNYQVRICVKKSITLHRLTWWKEFCVRISCLLSHLLCRTVFRYYCYYGLSFERHLISEGVELICLWLG